MNTSAHCSKRPRPQHITNLSPQYAGVKSSIHCGHMRTHCVGSIVASAYVVGGEHSQVWIHSCRLALVEDGEGNHVRAGPSAGPIAACQQNPQLSRAHTQAVRTDWTQEAVRTINRATHTRAHSKMGYDRNNETREPFLTNILWPFPIACPLT